MFCIQFLYISYIFSQFLGLLSLKFTGYEKSFLNEANSFYWIINLLAPVLLFFVIINYELKKYIHIFLLLSLFVLLVSFSLYFTKVFTYFLKKSRLSQIFILIF